MKHTVQEVFRKYGDVYLSKYHPSYEQKKVFNKILNCRTPRLGSHIYQCDSCGHQVFSYNSCKDRHCPNCGNYRKELWIENHQGDILNTTYYHVVITIPQELNHIFYQNQRKLYEIFFQTTSDTIMELAYDKKYLGAKVGITSMLHTWSQVGNYHPHIHMIVTGGGVNNLGKWVDAKNDFFLPVDKISKKIRYKLLERIKEEKLDFYNDYEYLKDKNELIKFLGPLYKMEWRCYIKPPFTDVNDIYNYLGKYAFRVCMSNDRISKIDGNYVYFTYKCHKDRSIERVMKIKGEEFIRKFLLHVLPASFMKIRYYGLISGRNKTARMNKLRILTNTKRRIEKFLNKVELLTKMNGRDVTKCRRCNGTLFLLQNTLDTRSPPLKRA